MSVLCEKGKGKNETGPVITLIDMYTGTSQLLTFFALQYYNRRNEERRHTKYRIQMQSIFGKGR
jgi:hypothetical protein